MADVPLNEESSDWLGWWETVKQHFPSLFDGTTFDLGQMFVEECEDFVLRSHLLEETFEQSLANLDRIMPMPLSPVDAATQARRAADRREQRLLIVATLAKHSA